MPVRPCIRATFVRINRGFRHESIWNDLTRSEFIASSDAEVFLSAQLLHHALRDFLRSLYIERGVN